MTLHHTKHHQAYVKNLNAALLSLATATSKNDIVAQLHLQVAINFNAGGHINHTLFWENLVPASSPSADPSSAPKLISALSARWGSVEKFQEAFNKVLLGIKGSGWGWLVQDLESGSLEIVTSKDQDSVPAGINLCWGLICGSMRIICSI
jgi:superoxide dismutase, Fe-Mn family